MNWQFICFSSDVLVPYVGVATEYGEIELVIPLVGMFYYTQSKHYDIAIEQIAKDAKEEEQ